MMLRAHYSSCHQIVCCHVMTQDMYVHIVVVVVHDFVGLAANYFLARVMVRSYFPQVFHNEAKVLVVLATFGAGPPVLLHKYYQVAQMMTFGGCRCIDWAAVVVVVDK